MPPKSKDKWVFGDFQTPADLAESAVTRLRQAGIAPQSILEPTCGKGAFLKAAIQAFPNRLTVVGVDINAQYLRDLKSDLARSGSDSQNVQLVQGDFFVFQWETLLSKLLQPILVIGNPPWVTNSELGRLHGVNQPKKTNFQKRRGLDAITGKSNFDISEWMLLQNLEWLKERRGVVAVLCKTAVARKVLLHAWKHDVPISKACLFDVDAQRHFDASVPACFLVIEMLGDTRSTTCLVYDDLYAPLPSQMIGYQAGIVLFDIAQHNKWQHLQGSNQAYVWRSGIKHDCSKVMELILEGQAYRNGLGEVVRLEQDYVYPMLKSSDLANGEVRYGRRCMLVTQQYIGQDTHQIQRRAPNTWRYLEHHSELLAKRASSIYRDRPKYSIFGVGDYAFAPWKVAISGFYKQLAFKVVEPWQDKAVVLDDTTNFLPCWSQSEAQFIARLLNSGAAQEFLNSMTFWSDKRPITIEILKRLDLRALSVELACEAEYESFARQRKGREMEAAHGQMSLGIAERKTKYAAKRKTKGNRD